MGGLNLQAFSTRNSLRDWILKVEIDINSLAQGLQTIGPAIGIAHLLILLIVLPNHFFL